MNTLQIRNPHSVLAALERRPQDVLRISLPRNRAPGDAWDRVAQLGRRHGVEVTEGETQGKPRSEPQRGRAAGKVRGGRAVPDEQGGRTGVAEATLREKESVSAEELFAGAREKKAGKGLWIALDTLQDPHNVGAIFRAAAFFGVEGILMTQERSAPLSAAVYDVASGGVEYVPFTMQVNLQRAFEVAKEAGLWILGTSEHAQDDLRKVDRDRPWLLVLGNEERGMRRLTEEACDVLCRIAPKGEVTSLNVSVAAGICISHLTS